MRKHKKGLRGYFEPPKTRTERKKVEFKLARQASIQRWISIFLAFFSVLISSLTLYLVICG